MQAFFTIKQKTIANGNPASSELEDGNDYCDSNSDDPSMPLLGQGKAEQTGVAETVWLKPPFLSLSCTRARTHKASVLPRLPLVAGS